MAPNLWRARLPLLVAGISLVIVGVVLERYRSLPARALDHALNYADFVLQLHRRDVKTFLASQYRRDDHPIPIDRNIDSALLPLKISGVRLSDAFSVPKVAGGIASIRNTLIILDRLGNLYALDRSGPIRKLNFPPLPANAEAYAAADGLIDSDHFRSYSAVFLPATRQLAVSHEIYDVEQKGTRIGVSLISLDPATLTPSGSWRTIFMGDLEPGGPTVTGGGRLAVDASENIYLSIGVYQIVGSSDAQLDSKLLGKIVRIDLAKGTVTVVSKGHRNPQGLVVADDGNIWSTEHGPSGGDKLNRIVTGANFGWPNRTLGTDYGRYSRETFSNDPQQDGFVPPVFAWVPSIAISNLVEVKKFDQRWNHDLLIGSLKAQSLYRVRLLDGHVLYSEQIWIGQRIRDLTQLEDGTIALWTDDAQVLFMSVDNQRLASDQRWPPVLGDTVITSCMLCHHFGPTGPADTAPSLSNIFDRNIASDEYRYSAALRSKQGKWTEETLKQFLADPDRFASGTSMPPRGLAPEQIDEVVATLKRLDDASRDR